jgi:hypothetical protein
MNPLITLKTIAPPLLITLALLCIGLLPRAQAVVPPPDGGYPGGNTAEGQNSLLSLTSGTYNTAVGFFSLSVDSTGSFNTANGAGTICKYRRPKYRRWCWRAFKYQRWSKHGDWSIRPL